jgi:glycosidase
MSDGSPAQGQGYRPGNGGRDDAAKPAAVLVLTARGTLIMCYGEEIGMGDVEIPPNERVDPPAARVRPDFAWSDRSRPRTPMPWSSGLNSGFTSGRPWLRTGLDSQTRNVQAQLDDPSSI